MPQTAQYKEMSVKDLEGIARDRGMSGYSSMKKDELIKALEKGGDGAGKQSSATNGSSRGSQLPGILAVLKQEHDEVKDLFSKFEKQAEKDLPGSTEIVNTILRELTRHAEMEEQIVYPALESADSDLYHEAHEEHHVAELLIKEIDGMQPDDAYKAKVMVLAENVRHHIDEEESQAFPTMRKLPKDQLESMATKWETVKSKVNEAVLSH